jgi:hypothetical protein
MDMWTTISLKPAFFLAITQRVVVESSWNVMAHGDARERKWRGNWRRKWIANTLHTTLEYCVSSINTADSHTSPASSRLNWRPRRFKLTRSFRRKTKSGFCTCAITFQTQSNILPTFRIKLSVQSLRVKNYFWILYLWRSITGCVITQKNTVRIYFAEKALWHTTISLSRRTLFFGDIRLFNLLFLFIYRVIKYDCRGFNNLSYTIHLR